VTLQGTRGPRAWPAQRSQKGARPASRAASMRRPEPPATEGARERPASARLRVCRQRSVETRRWRAAGARQGASRDPHCARAGVRGRLVHDSLCPIPAARRPRARWLLRHGWSSPPRSDPPPSAGGGASAPDRPAVVEVVPGSAADPRGAAFSSSILPLRPNVRQCRSHSCREQSGAAVPRHLASC
jgi:hypothetical protein